MQRRLAWALPLILCTELSLNGSLLGTLAGSDLAKALFAIWLGSVPVDDSLKQALLGR